MSRSRNVYNSCRKVLPVLQQTASPPLTSSVLLVAPAVVLSRTITTSRKKSTPYPSSQPQPHQRDSIYTRRCCYYTNTTYWYNNSNYYRSFGSSTTFPTTAAITTTTTTTPTATTPLTTTTDTTISTVTTKKPSRGGTWNHPNNGPPLPIPLHIKDLMQSSSSSQPYYHRGYYGVSSSAASSLTTTPLSSGSSQHLFDDTNSIANIYHPNHYHHRNIDPDDANSSSRSSDTTSDTEDDNPLIVVLDLDECLVHSHFLHPSINAAMYAHQLHLQQRRKKQMYSSLTNRSSSRTETSFDSFRIEVQEEFPGFNYLQHHNMHHGANQTSKTTHVQVFLRPGCIEFLDTVTKLYPTYIYTASQSFYANPVLNYLTRSVHSRHIVPEDPTTTTTTTTTTAASNTNNNNCIFRGRFYREHCIYDYRTNRYYKDLTHLHRHERNCTISSQTHKMVLIDNNPVSLLRNPNNGILVDSFYGPFQPEPIEPLFPYPNDDTTTTPNSVVSETDHTFTNLLQYLQQLSTVKDVRPIIQKDKKRWYSTGYSWSHRNRPVTTNTTNNAATTATTTSNTATTTTTTSTNGGTTVVQNDNDDRRYIDHWLSYFPHQ